MKKDFSIWKTVKFNTDLKNANDVRMAFKEEGYKMSNDANYLLEKIKFGSYKNKELLLVILSIYELGFHQGASLSDVINRAKEIGLSVCPAELGPQLRLQYFNQPEEWIKIAMQPIKNSNDDFLFFNLVNDEGHNCLMTSSSSGYWKSNSRWIFCLS